MLVPIALRDKCLAALRLMNALDKMKFFQFFQGSIHRDQAQGRVLLTRDVEHLNGSQSPRGRLDRLDDRTPRFREAVSVFLELIEPGTSSQRCLSEIENRFQ